MGSGELGWVHLKDTSDEDKSSILWLGESWGGVTGCQGKGGRSRLPSDQIRSRNETKDLKSKIDQITTQVRVFTARSS